MLCCKTAQRDADEYGLEADNKALQVLNFWFVKNCMVKLQRDWIAKGQC